MMRAVILAALLLVAAPAAAQRYVVGTEDVPLMAGLTVNPGPSIAFDSAAGRIVTVYARGTMRADAVLDFYRRTLPALGWAVEGARVFRREGERLSIDASDSSTGSAVRFTLVPSP